MRRSLLILAMLAGCACPAGDVGPALERAADAYTRASTPAPGVDPERHARLGLELERAAQAVTRAHAE